MQQGPAPALALLRRCRNVLRGAAPALPLSRPAALSLSLSRDWSRASQELPTSPSRRLRALRDPLATLPTALQAWLRPLRLLQTSRPTQTATGTPSSTPTASPRLPLSLQPPSPSRLTPLVLVGALATSAAVAGAKPPSAPCGERSNVLSPVPCAISAGVASSCGLVSSSVCAGLLFRWWCETDFGGLLCSLPPAFFGARLSLRIGSVLRCLFSCCSASRPWPTRVAHSASPVSALEFSVHFLEGFVHLLPYSVSPLGRPI